MIQKSQRALALAITHAYRFPRRPELAGGDVVALTRHDDGSTAILLGDVSAKGGEGSAFASWLATVFQVASAFVRSPAGILNQLNTSMAHAFYDETAGLFATAFVCRIFPRKSYLVYSCAGAEPPILFRNTGAHTELRSGGTVLGVDRQASYVDSCMRIAHDDALIAFTDGISESRHPDTLEQLGAGGVLSAIRGSLMEHGIHDSHHILTTIDSMTAGSYSDDATLLVASVRAA
jgi:serine phosphatase RsbU (regulator of sigma subunit)